MVDVLHRIRERIRIKEEAKAAENLGATAQLSNSANRSCGHVDCGGVSVWCVWPSGPDDLRGSIFARVSALAVWAVR